MEGYNRHHQWDEPDSENDFDFTQEVQKFSTQIHGALVRFTFADLFGMPFSPPVADIRQFTRHESMNDGAEKDYCGNQIEGLFLNSVLQDLWDALDMGIFITLQTQRKFVNITTGNRVAAEAGPAIVSLPRTMS